MNDQLKSYISKELEMESDVIETRQIDSIKSEPFYFFLPDGKKKYIGAQDQDFFFQLRDLPYETKIKLMRLSTEQMLNYINAEKSERKNVLTDLLNKKWYWRSDGEPCKIGNDYIEGIPYDQIQIKRKLKADKFTLEEINTIIDWLYGDNAEVYTKDSER